MSVYTSLIPHIIIIIILACATGTVERRDIRQMELGVVISLKSMNVLLLIPQKRETWQDLSITPVM